MQLFWVFSCAQAEVAGFRQRARFISLPRVLLLLGGKGYSEGEPVVAHSETEAGNSARLPFPGKVPQERFVCSPKESRSLDVPDLSSSLQPRGACYYLRGNFGSTLRFFSARNPTLGQLQNQKNHRKLLLHLALTSAINLYSFFLPELKETRSPRETPLQSRETWEV